MTCHKGRGAAFPMRGSDSPTELTSILRMTFAAVELDRDSR